MPFLCIQDPKDSKIQAEGLIRLLYVLFHPMATLLLQPIIWMCTYGMQLPLNCLRPTKLNFLRVKTFIPSVTFAFLQTASSFWLLSLMVQCVGGREVVTLSMIRSLSSVRVPALEIKDYSNVVHSAKTLQISLSALQKDYKFMTSKK